MKIKNEELRMKNLILRAQRKVLFLHSSSFILPL